MTLPLSDRQPHGLIRLGDVVTAIPEYRTPDGEPSVPDPPDPFPGALVPIDSLPRSVPSC